MKGSRKGREAGPTREEGKGKLTFWHRTRNEEASEGRRKKRKGGGSVTESLEGAGNEQFVGEGRQGGWLGFLRNKEERFVYTSIKTVELLN